MVYGRAAPRRPRLSPRAEKRTRARFPGGGCGPPFFRSGAGRKSRGGLPARRARRRIWRSRVQALRVLARPDQQLGRSRWAGAFSDRSDDRLRRSPRKTCFCLGEVAESLASTRRLRGADSWSARQDVFRPDHKAIRFAFGGQRRHGSKRTWLAAARNREVRREKDGSVSDEDSWTRSTPGVAHSLRNVASRA